MRTSPASGSAGVAFRLMLAGCCLGIAEFIGGGYAYAQDALRPPLTFSISANSSRNAVVTQGWPLVITAAVLHEHAFTASAVPFQVNAVDGSWARAVRFRLRDSSGGLYEPAFQEAGAPGGALTVDAETVGKLTWYLPAEATALISPGQYLLDAYIDSTAFDAAGYAAAYSPPVRLRFEPEPGSLSPEREAEKYLRLAEYETISGRDADALAHLDALLTRQPQHDEALFRRARILELLGRPWEALGSYQQALQAVYSQEEQPDEPPVAILGSLSALVDSIERAVSFEVAVEQKPAHHPYAGQGHADAYTIDGIGARELYLERGTTYTFRMKDLPPATPLYFSTSPTGAGAEPYAGGVTGAPASGSADITFTPDANTPDLLYYQSTEQPYMGWRIRIWGSSTAVDTEPDSPPELLDGYFLSEVYPNPFNLRARFTLQVAESQHVTIMLYDLLGRRVRTLHDGPLAHGVARVFVVEAGDLSSGIYIVRAVGESFVSSRSAVLIK